MIQTWPPVAQCQLCQITFSDQSAINADHDTAHAQSHTRASPSRRDHLDGRRVCEVCGRKFTSTSNLRQHLRTVHSAVGPRHKCDVCGKKFTQNSHLSRHLRTVHSADGRIHQCDVCGSKFKRSDCLNFHLRTLHSADGQDTSASCAAGSLHIRAT